MDRGFVTDASGRVKKGWGALGSNKLESGDLIHVGKKVWEVVKQINYRKMKFGKVYAYSYKKYNSGWNIFEFRGYSDLTLAYGRGGPIFKTIQGVARRYKVKSLREIEKLDDKLLLDYGHTIYMCTNVLVTVQTGCYYYIFEGRWCRGSGAEPLTFYQVRRVK